MHEISQKNGKFYTYLLQQQAIQEIFQKTSANLRNFAMPLAETPCDLYYCDRAHLQDPL